MFGSHTSSLTPTAASLQVSTTTHAATPTSPTRSSRLRGLSYLRSYTNNHLHHHHRSPSSDSSSLSRPSLSRSNTTPTSLGRRQSRTSHLTQPTSTTPLQSVQSVQSTQPTQSVQPEQAHPSPSPRRNTSNTGIEAPTSGWLPTVGGQSGLSRVAPQPQPTQSDSSSTNEPVTMTRRRAATSTEEPSMTTRPEVTRAPTASTTTTTIEPNGALETTVSKKDMPTIRLIPHHEPRAPRPSLVFPIVTRTLPTNGTRVRVGRYSERDSGAADALTNPLSTAPVGFKSKVVSRRHCEFWCESGQWFVKDVKSSSGTFLNHVRLSSPGMESRAYPVNDGDIVQLGIDFKGGEEQIFRCVKIRVECNRGWQKSLNQFNTSTHKRLLKRTQSGTAAAKDSDTQSTHSSECSICLCPVAPCQALFVAPCSHVWHYKCIRTLIYPAWPSFQCPNCRAYADLEADVDQPEEVEEEYGDMADAVKQSQDDANRKLATDSTAAAGEDSADEEEVTEIVASTSIRGSSTSPQPPTTESSGSDGEVGSTATSNALPIISSTNAPVNKTLPESIMARSATPTSTTQFALAAGMLSDGPPTPMNDAGPFLFESTNARRTRPVGVMTPAAVREEAEESGV